MGEGGIQRALKQCPLNAERLRGNIVIALRKARKTNDNEEENFNYVKCCADPWYGGFGYTGIPDIRRQ